MTNQIRQADKHIEYKACKLEKFSIEIRILQLKKGFFCEWNFFELLKTKSNPLNSKQMNHSMNAFKLIYILK